MPAPSLAAGAAARGLGSAVSQPALPHFSGRGLSSHAVGQLPVPHKPGALAGSVVIVERATLTRFPSALVGRTQPTLLHSAGASLLPVAQPALSQARVWVPLRTSARAAKNER